MTSKRAQITLFIVAGIFMLALIGFIIYMTSDRAPQPVQNDMAKPVSEFLDVCAKDAAIEAVRIVSMQGGYYNPPKESSMLNGFVIADYYRDVPRVPGMDQVNGELAKAAEERFSACDLSSLNDLGYDVGISDVSAIAYASEIGVRFRYSYKADIRSENEQAIETSSESFIPVGLEKSHDVASKFIEEQAKDPMYIPLTYLSDLCVRNLLVYEMHKESDHIVYSIVNKAQKLKGEPYTYAFSVNYGEDKVYFSGPQITQTPVLTASIGKVFVYSLNYSGAYAYTDMFNASGGKITFIPKPEDLGMHEVLVIANTTSGWKTITMNLNVTEADDA